MAIGQTFLKRIPIGAALQGSPVCMPTPSREIYRTEVPLPLWALVPYLEEVVSQAVQPADQARARIFVDSANTGTTHLPPGS